MRAALLVFIGMRTRIRAPTPPGGLALTAVRGSIGIPGRDVRPAAQSLFFAWPKKRNQKKGHPNCLRPPLALREPAVLAQRGHAANSLRSNMRPADPRWAALLGAYRWGPRGAGSARLRRASRLGRELGGPFGYLRLLGRFSGIKSAFCAYGMGVSSSCFLLSTKQRIYPPDRPSCHPLAPPPTAHTNLLAALNWRLRNTFKDAQGMHNPPTTPCSESAGLL